MSGCDKVKYQWECSGRFEVEGGAYRIPAVSIYLDDDEWTPMAP